MLAPLFPEQLEERETEQRMLGILLAAAHRKGWLAYHAFDTRTTCTSCGARRAPSRGRGFPDLFLAKGGRVLVRELKGPGGRVSSDQQIWIDELRSAGVDAAVARPTDVDALLDVIVGRTPRGPLEVR